MVSDKAETIHKDTKLSYRDAMAELENILKAIDDGDIDIDDLAEQVERAAYLLTWCQQKVTHTRLQIHKIIETLDAPLTDEDA